MIRNVACLFVFILFQASLLSCASSLGLAGPQTDWLLNPESFNAFVKQSEDGRELELSNGLLRRLIRLHPNAATVALDNLASGESILRGVKPEAIIEIDGKRYDIGGLKGQPNYAFLRPEWVTELKTEKDAFQFIGFEIGKPVERFGWKRTRHHSAQSVWPPKGVTLRLDFEHNDLRGVRVSVHYELYDGIPCYCKWFSIRNDSKSGIRIDSFSSEILAAVERVSEVDELSDGRQPPNIHIETDMAFGGMMASGANRRSYRWLPDPEFHTQVNYEKKTPCLLDIGPDLGPAQVVEPMTLFESFRAWVLPMDSSDRERCGLSVRRMIRIVAPWATENPIMMHLISSDEEKVKVAVDQCAEVGFEMLILSFGSGFNMEKEDPSILEKAKRLSSYARSKGIEIGSYSLLASRKVGGGNDVVMPPGRKPAFGNSPCLQSQWGQNYFHRLDVFHRESGFTLLEHDGSYPGDECACEEHPGHRGLSDSRWNQWRVISDFYKWCRSEGLYLNVPDHYFMSGSSKTGMGYREVNWSLPREQQVIHTRQNIYDGTWQKLPSMGWMFVPLTEYQGGEALATIEPLDQHLDHYQRMMESNLALGVQACYRGPRLYDTQRTKEMVASQVSWFKSHRDILESELIHGRRADARDLDWMLHVNPSAKEKGMLVVFNPRPETVRKTLRVNVYYTGIGITALVRDKNGTENKAQVGRDYVVDIDVEVAPQGMSWFVLEKPD